ncbi:type II secretion system protein [Cognatiyoonia sp. IB215182]|uniref:PulJ/GspJ family protein n=1 Tax=Cognatiyoonia sp. IB215182 TaxID=3097353 RepID=UPI002A166B81|nr:type II secretion system protein [Cognatiyoonia sp. IB215182]MDX8353210.1 type II secretion system protein [Cognatiyoonia sp. IB215182]
MIRRHGQRGFTLVESLVALAIATLAISGFYQALSTGLFMERRSGVQAEQMLVATQVMDRIGADVPLRAGAQDRGIIRGLEWELTITETGTADMRIGTTRPNEMFFVYVTVNSGLADGTPLVLRSLRYRETPL